MSDAEDFVANCVEVYRKRADHTNYPGGLWARRGDHSNGAGSFFYPDPAVALTWSGFFEGYPVTWVMRREAARALAWQLLEAVGDAVPDTGADADPDAGTAPAMDADEEHDSPRYWYSVHVRALDDPDGSFHRWFTSYSDREASVRMLTDPAIVRKYETKLMRAVAGEPAVGPGPWEADPALVQTPTS